MSLRRIVVLLFSVLFVASAEAQLTINRYVNASNAVVGIGQDKFSTLNWANNGFTNITGVSARVVLSSVSPPDDVFFLGDTAAFLSYNIGETNGVTNAVVFPFDGTNDATSLDATFVVTNSFTSPGLTNEWDLTVSSSLTNSGDIVFNYWRLILTGGAVTNGTIEPGAQGIISGSDGYAVTATVSAGSGTGSNAVTAFVTNSQSLNFNGGISGSGELAKTGAGTLSVGSSTNFSGSFRLAEGTANFTATNSLGTGTLVQSDGSSTAIFSAGGTYTQNMSLYNVSFTNGGNVLSGTITNNNTTYTVSAGTTNTLSGVLTGTGGVTKEGDGELVIAGSANNTYTGATVVNDGSLVLSNSSGNAIDSSSSITVNSGGTLVLGASNQIGDGIGLILNGGTFITGDSSNRYSETLGTLTLTADSTLDLGGLLSGSATLQFADSSAINWTPGAILTITNWQGTAFTPSTISTILFSTNTGLTPTQLGQIRFASQGGLIGGLVGSELVPVPEPQVYAGALALVAFVIWRERKRLASLLRRR